MIREAFELAVHKGRYLETLGSTVNEEEYSIEKWREAITFHQNLQLPQILMVQDFERLKQREIERLEFHILQWKFNSFDKNNFRMLTNGERYIQEISLYMEGREELRIRLEKIISLKNDVDSFIFNYPTGLYSDRAIQLKLQIEFLRFLLENDDPFKTEPLSEIVTRTPPGTPGLQRIKNCIACREILAKQKVDFQKEFSDLATALRASISPNTGERDKAEIFHIDYNKEGGCDLYVACHWRADVSSIHALTAYLHGKSKATMLKVYKASIHQNKEPELKVILSNDEVNSAQSMNSFLESIAPVTDAITDLFKSSGGGGGGYYIPETINESPNNSNEPAEQSATVYGVKSVNYKRQSYDALNGDYGLYEVVMSDGKKINLMKLKEKELWTQNVSWGEHEYVQSFYSNQKEALEVLVKNYNRYNN